MRRADEPALGEVSLGKEDALCSFVDLFVAGLTKDAAEKPPESVVFKLKVI